MDESEPRLGRTAFSLALAILALTTLGSASVADTAPSCKDPTKGRWHYWMFPIPDGCEVGGQTYPVWVVYFDDEGSTFCDGTSAAGTASPIDCADLPQLGYCTHGCNWQGPKDVVIETCDGECEPKCAGGSAEGPAGAASDASGLASSDTRPPGADPAKRVGDPVDVTTGHLLLTLTDLDLGHGLRLTRHYVSGREVTGSPPPVPYALGRGWSHSLEWELRRTVSSPSGRESLVVHQPNRGARAFSRSLGSADAFSNGGTSGSAVQNGDGSVVYTDPDGTIVRFDASDAVTSIEPAGEPPIAVTHTATTDTFSQGGNALVLTYTAAVGQPSRRLASAEANGKTWSYAQDASDRLWRVIGPHPTNPTGTVEWQYTYESASFALLRTFTRTTDGKSLGAWTYGNDRRVATADEPALDQRLTFVYAPDTPSAGVLQTTVKDPAGATLATYQSQGGRVLSVSGLGGPGVEVPMASGTLEMQGTLALPRWRTRTDLAGT